MSKPTTLSRIFDEARQTFPQLEPSQPAGFANLDNGLSVTITHNSGQLVLCHQTDLQRTISFCQAALERRQKP